MQIDNTENVARVIFSPKMIYNGKLLPAAFELRGQISEDYLSVLRTSVPSWKSEMQMIPNRKNRTAVGYALLNVGETRGLSDKDTVYDVCDKSKQSMKSHAGITITYHSEQVVGEKPLNVDDSSLSEDYIRMAMRYKLVKLAQKRLVLI